MKIDAEMMAKEFYEARNPSMKWSSLVWWEKLHMAVLAEREACARACEKQRDIFGSPRYASGQPMSSVGERFAAGRCAEVIRARGDR